MTGAPTPTAEACFREVFVHLPEVVAYARRRGSRDPEAIGAEALTIAWRKLAEVPMDDARPWLFATARNLLLAEWRKASAADGRGGIPEMAREGEPEVQILDPELERCLRALSARDRACSGAQVRDQNVSLSPICPVLVDATLVIWPKLGATTFRTGLLYCGQLKTLNDSKRT